MVMATAISMIVTGRYLTNTNLAFALSCIFYHQALVFLDKLLYVFCHSLASVLISNKKLQLKATVMELVAIIDMEGYNLGDEVTYVLLLELLKRPRNLDLENALFVQFYNNIGKSFRNNKVEMMVLRSGLNSLA